MSDAPETIWIDDSIRPWRVWRMEIAGLTEYRRADLPPTPAQIMADARVKALVEALEWYGEQCRLARLIHKEGDPGRHRIAADGGKRANAAIAALEPAP